MQNIDHLVYAVPVLKDGIKEMKASLGVEPTKPCPQIVWGTHHAWVGLGATCYLDIVSIDSKLKAPEEPRPFGVERVDLPKLTTWTLKTDDLEKAVASAKEAGFLFTAPREYSCKTADGKLLKWQFAFPAHPDTATGLVPSLIHWEKASHPGKKAPQGCKLLSLSAEHPMPEKIQAIYKAMGVQMEIKRAFIPKLIACLSTPKGEVCLS